MGLRYRQQYYRILLGGNYIRFRICVHLYYVTKFVHDDVVHRRCRKQVLKWINFTIFLRYTINLSIYNVVGRLYVWGVSSLENIMRCKAII